MVVALSSLSATEIKNNPVGFCCHTLAPKSAWSTKSMGMNQESSTNSNKPSGLATATTALYPMHVTSVVTNETTRLNGKCFIISRSSFSFSSAVPCLKILNLSGSARRNQYSSHGGVADGIQEEHGDTGRDQGDPVG